MRDVAPWIALFFVMGASVAIGTFLAFRLDDAYWMWQEYNMYNELVPDPSSWRLTYH